MKERPILIAVIGYIIGILWGLYFNFSVAFLYIFITVIFYIVKIIYLEKMKINKKRKKYLKLFSIKRYFRYIKLFLNQKSIFLIVVFSIISNFIVNFDNQKYENSYKDGEKLTLIAIINSNKEEKEYKDTYEIKIIGVKRLEGKELKDTKKGNYKNIKLILSINKNKKIELEYGDKIEVSGEFIEPSDARNYGGFDYKEYLKTIKIHGTIKADSINVLSKNSNSFIFTFSNDINLKIKENINKLIPEKYSAIFTGLILGDTSNVEEKVNENFKIANISHVLAISGMHITYIIIGIEIILKNAIGKRRTRIITIIVLVIYMFITGFSPSVVRASIMGIVMLISKLIHRKNDIWTSISLSLFILLMYNPFLILNVGLQLSYLGTIGIVCFNKNVYNFLRKLKIRNRKIRYRINRKFILLMDKIKEILSVTLSAQIVILPILLFNFNILGIYFFISNILVSVIIGPIIIVGFVCILISFISIKIAKILSIFMSVGIQILISISEISHLPFSKIYIPTPKVWQIVIYYICVIVINKIYMSFNLKEPDFTSIRIRNLVAVLKFKFRQNRKKILRSLIVFVSLVLILNIIPKKLKIYFVDVGQGDCTFITTPQNKTILIDGGGSMSEEYDVGESTLLPYILDRGYTKIDYIFISHFDQDHVGGILTILEELKVGQVYIAKQEQDSENYQKFLKVVKDKKIKVKVLKQGDCLKIEKNLYFDILWPIEEQIQENILNNNAMVMKLRYGKFSMLFTGDIEEVAEEKILEFYKEKIDKGENILKSKVLKVAHHGSKTSTTQSFFEKVNPEICLIGVGKNNMFGHPTAEVLERISGTRIYRTDEEGEIVLEVECNGDGPKMH